MKKLLTLLLIFPFLISCSSDDENTEPTQDYTSFVVLQNSDTDLTLPNAVAGYYTSDGKCKKVADLGDLKKGVESKEIKVSDDITYVYIFSDYPQIATKLDKKFELTKNKKNIITLTSDLYGITVDPNNENEYPH